MAARGLAVIARRLAPKLLKHVGSAVAGSVLSKAFDKLFSRGKGRGRRRRRIRGGFRLFNAPGLVRDRPLLPQSFSKKKGTTTRRHSARGGSRRRRHRYRRRK